MLVNFTKQHDGGEHFGNIGGESVENMQEIRICAYIEMLFIEIYLIHLEIYSKLHV